ncbi:transporter substrate-binding domain-containing protein [soil metagenome]
MPVLPLLSQLLRVLLRACAALSLSGLCQAALAQAPKSLLDTAQSAGVLRICTTGDFKPFTIAKGEDYEGIDIEMGRSLAKALGVEPRFVRTKWPELMPDVLGGKCDVAMGGIGITLERAKRVFFSAPTFQGGAAPLVRCADKTRFQTIAEIDKPDVKVIVNPGGNNERFARGNFKQAGITVHADNLTVFDEILAGRADVMVTSAIEGLIQEKQRPGLCVVNADKPFTFSEIAYVLPLGDVNFKAFVDQWIRIAISSGEYKRYYDRFVH